MQTVLGTIWCRRQIGPRAISRPGQIGMDWTVIVSSPQILSLAMQAWLAAGPAGKVTHELQSKKAPGLKDPPGLNGRVGQRDRAN